MPFSATQLRALEALDWLFDSRHGRREGRSLVWAIALVREAARCPGQWMEISDHAEMWTHNRHRHLHELARENIRMLVEREPGWGRYFEMDQHHFRLNLPQPIPDWLPDMGPYQAPAEVQRADMGGSAADYPTFVSSAAVPPGEIRAVSPSGTIDPVLTSRFMSGFKITGAQPRRTPRTAWERLQEDD